MWTQVKEEICGRFCYPSRVGALGEWTSWTDRSGWLAWAGAGQGSGSPLGPWSQRRGAPLFLGRRARLRGGGPGPGDGRTLFPSRGGGGPGELVQVPAGSMVPPWGTRTGSRRGPPCQRIQSLGFPGAQHVGLVRRPCPARGNAEESEPGDGARSLATRLPVWASRVSFDPGTPRNCEPCLGKLLSPGPAPRKSEEPVQCSEAVSGARAHKDLLCKINKIIPTGLISGLEPGVLVRLSQRPAGHSVPGSQLRDRPPLTHFIGQRA